MNAPATVPEPPSMLTPPTTTAAITWNSRPVGPAPPRRSGARTEDHRFPRGRHRERRPRRRSGDAGSLEPGGLRVVADGVQRAAEHEAPRDVCHHHGQDDGHQDEDRHPGDLLRRHAEEPTWQLAGADVVAARDEEGDAPVGVQGPERRDDGRHPAHGHEGSVDGAEAPRASPSDLGDQHREREAGGLACGSRHDAHRGPRHCRPTGRRCGSGRRAPDRSRWSPRRPRTGRSTGTSRGRRSAAGGSTSGSRHAQEDPDETDSRCPPT